MNHRIIKYALLAVLILVPGIALAEGLMFSVSPGQLLESAQFGISMGTIAPYIGVDMVRGSVSYEEADDEDTYEASGSAMILAPHVGARLYVGTGDVRPYLVGDIQKSFGFFDIKSETNGEDNIGDSADDLKDAVKNALGFWGFAAGFGAEYNFAEKFSVGGEYRLSWLHLSTGEIGDDPNTMKISADIHMTASRVWLNYKF